MEYIKKTIKPGMNLLEIRKLCEEKLLELAADSFWYWDVGAFVFAGDEILQLYLYLHEKSIPEDSQHLRSTWDNIINDANHHLIVCEIDGKIVASCVCVIIPNLTRNVRPYAFVENVVTHGEYRNKGYATACLNFAKKIAEENNCYKMMLLTGSKEESTLNFYRNAGYNNSDKTAFIQWIDI